MANLAKGRLFAKFWRAKMNAGRNTWAASAETPKLYSPKQPFCSFAKILSLQFYPLYVKSVGVVPERRTPSLQIKLYALPFHWLITALMEHAGASPLWRTPETIHCSGRRFVVREVEPSLPEYNSTATITSVPSLPTPHQLASAKQLPPGQHGRRISEHKIHIYGHLTSRRL